jgi:hypothetical protein
VQPREVPEPEDALDPGKSSMVVHHVKVNFAIASQVTANAVVVRAPSQLRDALADRTNPVVIDNEALERSFSRLERWHAREHTYRLIATLIAGLLALAISQQYKLELNWRSIGSSIGLMEKSRSRQRPNSPHRAVVRFPLKAEIMRVGIFSTLGIYSCNQ